MNYKLILGDAREEIKKIPDNTIDLIILDPPYLLLKEKWDKKDIIDVDFIADLHRVLKKDGNLYCWCGIGEKSQSLIRWFPLFSKFFFKDLIIWKKTRGIGMRKGWLYTREEIMWFVKDKKNYKWIESEQYSDELRKPYGFKLQGSPIEERMKSKYKRLTNVWCDIHEVNFYNSKEYREFCKLHATPKPVKLLERILRVHTIQGDIVLDPFMGSGSVGIACCHLDRNYIGIELLKEYYELAKKRIEREVGLLLSRSAK